MRHSSFWTVATALLASVAMPAVVRAQEATGAAVTDAAKSDTPGEGEIIVTAQRREQKLQDVPITMSAVGAERLEAAGVVTTQDLPAITPGLTTTTLRNGLTPYLRGVGTQSGTSEQSVALYVDNVYVAATAASLFSLNNIERIEVLKGPQGTLFGRNATGGLIHVITRDPSTTPELKATLGYGNYDTVMGSVYATTGLAPNVAMDIAAYASHQGDGWGKNLVLGNDVNLARQWSLRSKLKAELGEATTVTLAGDYNRSKSDLGNTRQTADGTVATGGITRIGTIYDFNSSFSGGPVYKATQWGTSLRINHDFSDAVSLTSTTAYRKNKYPSYTDTDATPAYLVDGYFIEKSDTVQQELLLNGSSGRLDWTLGAFYYEYDRGMQPLIVYTVIPRRGSYRFTNVSTKSYSGFGQGTYALTDQTNLTLGARFTKENGRVRGQIRAFSSAGPNGVLGPVTFDTETRTDGRSNTDSAKKLTWRIALDHQFSDDLMVYASYNRGFKSGTFNPFAIDDLPTVPETIDAYEVGFKSDLFEDVLRLNASAFYYDYKDIQVSTVLLVGTGDRNAAKGRIKGADLEMVVSPPLSRGRLNLRANASYLDTEYVDYAGAVANVPNVRINGVSFNTPGTLCPRVVAGLSIEGTRTGGNTTCSLDASGKTMIRAPKFSSNLGADYEIPVGGDKDLQFNLNWQHTGKFFWDPYNLFAEKSYDLVNAQIGFGPGDDAWKVRLWGRNLTKTEYYSQVSPGGTSNGAAPGAPRTYGIALDVQFGGR